MKAWIEELFYRYIEENQLDIELSYSMPEGYENAFGTFDITNKTLFFNDGLIKRGPTHEALFYFYHELRHAMQYIHPQQFDAFVQASLPYVLLYNGICFKLVDGAWKSCRLSGEETYFTLAYESLPYEIDANKYACETVKALLPEYAAEIESLCRSWVPEQTLPPDEVETVFRRIDQELENKTG